MSTTPPPGTYVIDLSHTHAGFAVKHFGLSKVRGEFTQVDGSVVIAEDPAASSVTATISTASFESRDAKRDEHVRSADFLGGLVVGKNVKIVLEVQAVVPQG